MRHTYLIAQVVAGMCVFGVVTAGRAVWVGADYAVQGLTGRGQQ